MLCCVQLVHVWVRWSAWIGCIAPQSKTVGRQRSLLRGIRPVLFMCKFLSQKCRTVSIEQATLSSVFAVSSCLFLKLGLHIYCQLPSPSFAIGIGSRGHAGNGQPGTEFGRLACLGQFPHGAHSAGAVLFARLALAVLASI